MSEKARRNAERVLVPSLDERGQPRRRGEKMEFVAVYVPEKRSNRPKPRNRKASRKKPASRRRSP